MRKLAATYLFTSQSQLIKNAILVCENNGTIADIVVKENGLREEAGLELYSGILVPGFVNAHCHLELSHLHNKIEENAGLAGFLGSINRLQEIPGDEINKAMNVADRRMWASGIAAVGDISNSSQSLSIKKEGKISYHTFVEVFGFHPSRAGRAFKLAQEVHNEFSGAGLSSSIVPHAAYSVSETLFEMINHRAKHDNSILSIHNQESSVEATFFKDGNGPIKGHYQKNLKLDTSHWQARKESSLEFILKRLPTQNQLLLVHNTFTGEADLNLIKQERLSENTFLVLCPNSNLFIENQLPPINLFQDSGYSICLGTDSLASNHQLSILEEMITIQKYFPETKLEDLFNWACFNGAQALKLDNTLGSFGLGKKPGVNLLTGIDLKQLKLTPHTKVKRLL